MLFVFSSWLSGWAVGDGNVFLCSGVGTETPALVRTCLSCSLAPARTELSLGRALLPGGVCRAELSTQRVWDGLCEQGEGGDVGTEKEVLAKSSMQQRHGQGGRKMLPAMLWEEGLRRLPAIPCSADAFPGATPCSFHSLGTWPGVALPAASPPTSVSDWVSLSCLPWQGTLACSPLLSVVLVLTVTVSGGGGGDSSAAQTPRLQVLSCTYVHGGKTSNSQLVKLWGSGYCSV